MHTHDVAGYIAAQLLGAIFACGLLRAAWGRTARALQVGATQPGRGLTDFEVTAMEALMTAALILMILFFTSSARTAGWTPFANWLLVATLVWRVPPTPVPASTPCAASDPP